MKNLVLMVALFLTFSATSRAESQARPKSPRQFISRRDLALELPTVNWKDKNYSIQITRQFSSSKEGELLKKAEALYPTPNTILAEGKAMGGSFVKQSPRSEDLWWWSEFDGVRIPYAITASAVTYYYRLMQEFRKGYFSHSGNFKMYHASLMYVSSIKRQARFTLGKQTFRNVYVASMELKWSQHCGNLCAMFFDKKRTVVFQRNGSITVSGDAAESVIVS